MSLEDMKKTSNRNFGIIENGKLNMTAAIKKFMDHYYELYNESSKKFLEKECRLLFLTYLKPLINGVGFYHIESETRNSQRMDVIVDFSDQQLIEYLNSKNKSEGYLLTFDFRKRSVKKPSAKWVRKGKKKFLDCLCV